MSGGHGARTAIRLRVASDDRRLGSIEEAEAAIKHFSGVETVFVRAASMDVLRDAYPSYFADTWNFVPELGTAIAWGPVAGGWP